MTVDFYALLRKRIPDLEDLSASSRGGLYREVVASTAGMIADAKPPLTPGEAAELRTALDEAIKKIEAEFVKARLEDNQYAPDWALPPKPAAPAAAGHASTGDSSDWDEPIDLLALEQRFALPATRLGRAHANLRDHTRIVGALLRHAVKTAAGSERVAYLWLAIEPIIQVGLVVGLYWIFGRTHVYGMPSVPFAIIGVGGWLTFRTLLTRVATGLGREFALCYFPTITRFDVYLAKALFFGLSYSLASIVMLCGAYYFEIGGSPIDDALIFAFYWFLIWLFSLGFALSMNYFFILVPTTKRLLLVILRGLYFFSAVVVVTEQFSAEDKVFFLWNPLVHGMQLLRSTYFAEYKSDDASPAYFLGCTLGLFLLGLICERAQRRREIAP
jgi:capsular polysaccharide transport system permease protein